MPIRVRCSCGHSLSVPDQYAGKSGKCPKCGQMLKIPAVEAGGPAAAQAASAKSRPTATATAAKPVGKPAASAAPIPAASNPLDQLLSEAGIGKESGPTCPQCRAPVAAGQVLCVACGFHLESGQRLTGVASSTDAAQGQYSNKALNEADQSLRKEKAADDALKFVGAPWWVYLACVLGLCMVIAFGVIVKEGTVVDENGEYIRAAEGTIKGTIQRMPFLNAMLFIGMCVSGMVVWLATMATIAAAFQEKTMQGVLCLVIPVLYAYYYAFSRWKKIRKTGLILMIWSVVLVATFIGFMLTRPTANQSGADQMIIQTSGP